MLVTLTGHFDNLTKPGFPSVLAFSLPPHHTQLQLQFFLFILGKWRIALTLIHLKNTATNFLTRFLKVSDMLPFSRTHRRERFDFAKNKSQACESFLFPCRSCAGAALNANNCEGGCGAQGHTAYTHKSDDLNPPVEVE